jgi:hypothetical protein
LFSAVGRNLEVLELSAPETGRAGSSPNATAGRSAERRAGRKRLRAGEGMVLKRAG